MNITRPNRVTRTYKQRLVAEPSKVFPLLCPVREADWIEGWNPISVITSSGVGETDCVFVTSAAPHDAVWYITRHEPENGFVEMLKITPLLHAGSRFSYAPFPLARKRSLRTPTRALGPMVTLSSHHSLTTITTSS